MFGPTEGEHLIQRGGNISSSRQIPRRAPVVSRWERNKFWSVSAFRSIDTSKWMKHFTSPTVAVRSF